MNQRTRADQWPGIIAAQEKSGLGIGKFCEREKICRASFFIQRKQLKGTAARKGFKRIQVAYAMRDDVKGSEVQEGLRGIRIFSPNGYQLEINGCGQDELQRALEVISRL
jgi:hypothetical protein